jgi:light-regulated signal transduction histidine kinase (bacteriophytochrome)
MYDLIKRLPHYSTIGTKETTFSDVDINQILVTVNSNLTHVIKERDIKISMGKLPVISADRNQMIQLFQNLISNGIKFSKSEPTIMVSSKIENDNYVFSVRDNGIGIETQYFDKIFEIFKRLNLRDQFEGTGIGLAICKRIVENHNGAIWVESKPGKGSVFHFTIPIKK